VNRSANKPADTGNEVNGLQRWPDRNTAGVVASADERGRKNDKIESVSVLNTHALVTNPAIE
jgi:hypothetical protein